MFMDLFDVKKLPSNVKSDSKEDDKYDTSQYDAYEAAKERMDAEDAGKMLLRRDDEVDFQVSWGILKEMMTDEEYKEEVLGIIRKSPDCWW